jgi:hypothetical protein
MALALRPEAAIISSTPKSWFGTVDRLRREPTRQHRGNLLWTFAEAIETELQFDANRIRALHGSIDYNALDFNLTGIKNPIDRVKLKRLFKGKS